MLWVRIGPRRSGASVGCLCHVAAQEAEEMGRGVQACARLGVGAEQVGAAPGALVTKPIT
jgi:hypothetical protein